MMTDITNKIVFANEYEIGRFGQTMRFRFMEFEKNGAVPKVIKQNIVSNQTIVMQIDEIFTNKQNLIFNGKQLPSDTFLTYKIDATGDTHLTVSTEEEKTNFFITTKSNPKIAQQIKDEHEKLGKQVWAGLASVADKDYLVKELRNKFNNDLNNTHKLTKP